MDALLDTLRAPLPSDYSLDMGRRIHMARIERGMTQIQLAEQTKRRQATISDLENGKVEPETSMLILLALVLEKPLSYFLPEPLALYITFAELSQQQEELLGEFERISRPQDKDIAIDLIRTLADRTS